MADAVPISNLADRFSLLEWETKGRSLFGLDIATGNNTVAVTGYSLETGVGHLLIYESGDDPQSLKKVARFNDVRHFETVSVFGGTVVVGSPCESVHIFERGPDGVWEWTATIDGEDYGHWFGYQVQVYEKNIFMTGGDVNASAVYVFTKNEDGTWAESSVIPSRNEPSGFGKMIVPAPDGVVFISAPQYNMNQGVVYMFKLIMGGWHLIETLIAFDGMYDDFFGHDMSLDGDHLVVSARGALYVYDSFVDGYGDSATKIESDQEGFGAAVSIHHGYIAAPYQQVSGTGYVRVFSIANGEWQVLGDFEGGNQSPVFMNGLLLVQSPYPSGQVELAENSAVYIYKLSPIIINSGTFMEGIVVNEQRISSVSHLDLLGDLETRGSLYLTSTKSQGIFHSGANWGNRDFVLNSTDGRVVVESVQFNDGVVSGVEALHMTRSMTLSSDKATIHHTGNDHLRIDSSTGQVLVEDVGFAGGTIFGVSMLTLDEGIHMRDHVAKIVHTGIKSLSIESSEGDVVVENVAFNAGMVSGITDLKLQNMATISHQGKMTIGSATMDGTVMIEKTKFTSNGDVSGVSSLRVDSDISLANGKAAITHTGETSMYIQSPKGKVILEDIVFKTGTISRIKSLELNGAVTMTQHAATITHSGPTSLTIESTSGVVFVQSVTFSGLGAISGVSSLTFTEDNANILHRGATSLTIDSLRGDVVVEQVKFHQGKISDIHALELNADISSITHTGSSSLELTSQAGDVVVESIVFDQGTISGITSIQTSELFVGDSPIVPRAPQEAHTDISDDFDPGEGTIAGIEISSTYHRNELVALRGECEKLRNMNNELRTSFNELLVKLRNYGVLETSS